MFILILLVFYELLTIVLVLYLIQLLYYLALPVLLLYVVLEYQPDILSLIFDKEVIKLVVFLYFFIDVLFIHYCQILLFITLFNNILGELIEQTVMLFISPYFLFFFPYFVIDLFVFEFIKLQIAIDLLFLTFLLPFLLINTVQ